MKLKLPYLSGRVIVIKSDQQEAKKCYENSLKIKRGVFMVVECPPSADTPMEVEPVEETPAEAVPVEEAPAGAVPVEETPMEEMPGVALPMGEAPTEEASRRQGLEGVARAENSRDRRPEPVENVVERRIGGKTFKLGRLLGQEEQDQVAAVISCWTSLHGPPRTCPISTQIFYATISPWTLRSALCDRGRGSSTRKGASSCRKRPESC